jgi:general secretion pathway protein D
MVLFSPIIRRFSAASLLLAVTPFLLAQAPTVPSGMSASPSPSARVLARNADAARNAYVAGARLLDANHLGEAQAAFDRAEQLDPAVPDYHIAATLALEHRVTALVQQASTARLLGHTSDALSLLAQARTLDPHNEIILQHDEAAVAPPAFKSVFDPAIPTSLLLDGTDDLAGPIVPRPNTSHQSFHLHSDLQTAVREVFSRFGLHTAFDSSITPAATPAGIRFDLDDTTAAQAIPLILSMGRLFAVPLDTSSVLIATDTVANRTRLEHLYQETLYTPGLNPQQMGEVTNVIRQVFDVKQLSMQNSAGNITLRAPASTLDALNRTLLDLLDGTAEVILDLRVYAVDTTRQRNIGLSVPQQFGVYNVASAAQTIVSANQTALDQAIAQGALTIPAGADATTRLIYEAVFLIQAGLAQSSLLTDTIGFFGKGLALSGLTAGPATFNFALNTSDARTLDSLQLRVTDRQSTIFRAGTRYPITTSTYSTGLNGTNSAALAGATVNGVSVSSLLNQYLGSNSAGTTVPQIQYEDLGLTLKATPNVQSSGNITMHLDLKIEALAGSALNNIPLLASRQFASDVTVAEGQTALMLSSLSKTESVAVSGIPGLSELPGFQSGTADKLREVDTSELVMLITPHVVRHRANLTVGPRIPVSPSVDSSE